MPPVNLQKRKVQYSVVQKWGIDKINKNMQHLVNVLVEEFVPDKYLSAHGLPQVHMGKKERVELDDGVDE